MDIMSSLETVSNCLLQYVHDVCVLVLLSYDSEEGVKSDACVRSALMWYSFRSKEERETSQPTFLGFTVSVESVPGRFTARQSLFSLVWKSILLNLYLAFWTVCQFLQLSSLASKHRMFKSYLHFLLLYLATCHFLSTSRWISSMRRLLA